jgi:hypothetical protein
MAKSIVKQLKKLFKDDLVVYPYLSADGITGPTYGTPETYKARIIGKHKVVRSLSGKEEVSTVEVWIAGTPDLSHLDKFELPSRFTPGDPVCLSIMNVSDENGPHHVKVYFK